MKNIKPILLSILILAATFSASIYTTRLGQEKFMEELAELPPGLYAVIPVNIWYMLISMGILLFGSFLLCIVLGYFKGDGTIEEC